MKLNFDSFKKALKNLGKAVNRAQKSPSDEELRSAVIQRFEYTYELAWKMIKTRICEPGRNRPLII